MPAWFIDLLAKVLALLTKDLVTWAKGLWAKLVRSKEQDAAAAAAAANQGKPRDEKVRDDEKADIDS